MVYVVSRKSPKGKEVSLDQFLMSDVDFTKSRKSRYYPGTVTRCYESLPNGLYTQDHIRQLTSKLQHFSRITHFLANNLNQHYRHFDIPKQDGTMRKISEPLSPLRDYQVKLRSLFENDFYAAYHTSAFAYCEGRSTLLCIKRHQAAQSRWFLKIDFANFFGSTTSEFVFNQLSKIAPFSEVVKSEQGAAALKQSIEICFLENGLPQGTPISPMLTNLIMIPIDHEISRRLHSKGFVYTRYADDVLISHRYQFKPEEIIDIIYSVLKENNAPYSIKEQKTRYGSSSGRNWNLGLMLNKDNQITVGHKTHKLIKAKICGFMLDCINDKQWPEPSILKLTGQISYYQSVEPKTIQHIIEHLEQKYAVSFQALLKRALRKSHDNSAYNTFIDLLTEHSNNVEAEWFEI